MTNSNQISRFNGGGKTFFFNRRTASNDTEYLIVNAMYGNPPKYEKLVLFPQHLLEFSEHLDKAISELTGRVRQEDNGVSKDPQESDLPQRCPECGNEGADWEVVVFGVRHWRIDCQCGYLIYNTKEVENA